MIYIYDLILNWSNKRRYEFFEWNNNDEIEYIKKIPIFRISNFNEVIDSEFKVSDNFLNKIFNKTEVYNNRAFDKVEYCCILCDDVRAVACEFNDEGKLMYSSNIYFLDLEEVLNLSKKIKSICIEGNILNKKREVCDLYLTRKEIKKKKRLLEDINYSYQNKDLDKLKYYYYKLFNKESDDLEIIKRSLDNSLNNVYNYKHDELYKIMNLSIM